MKARLSPAAYAESIGLLLAWVALWWLASHGGWVSRVFLPTPEATWVSLETAFDEDPKVRGFVTESDRKVGKAKITLLRMKGKETAD